MQCWDVGFNSELVVYTQYHSQPLFSYAPSQDGSTSSVSAMLPVKTEVPPDGSRMSAAARRSFFCRMKYNGSTAAAQVKEEADVIAQGSNLGENLISPPHQDVTLILLFRIYDL